jgi:hypothetical protein
MAKSKPKTHTRRSRSQKAEELSKIAAHTNAKANLSVGPFPKYRKLPYTRHFINNSSNSRCLFYIEVEGLQIKSRGQSKGTTYFNCMSDRHINDPVCRFRGRIKEFNKEFDEGEIEIMQDHSATCKYIPGNEAHDYSRNRNLNPTKKLYKVMKEEVNKKLEEEDWLTPIEIVKWIKATFPINQHLNYSQVDEIVQDWRKIHNVSKESYVFQHPNTKSGLRFLRSYFLQNYQKK